MGYVRMLVCAVGGMLLASTGVLAEDPPADAAKPRKSAEEVAKMLEAFKAVKDTTPEGVDLYVAIGVLAEAEHPDVVKPIAKCLADPRERVGRGAAVALGKIGKALLPKERKPVLSALLPAIAFTGLRAPVAAEAVRALGQIGEMAAAPSLVPLIEAKDNATAKAAVEALAVLPLAAAIDPLCSELMKLEPATARPRAPRPAATTGPAASARASAPASPRSRSRS